MNEFQVTKVNNVSIVCVENNNKRLVPIKPICEALGIAFEPQFRKLQSDEDLCSTVTSEVTVGGDGKQREMVCLPYEFIFGWLFTINPKNVKPEAQIAVREYRMQCYQALYEYFTEPQTFLKQKQALIEEQVKLYQSKQANFKNARKEMDEAKRGLNEILAVTIDDWRANNRQLIIPFTPEDEEEVS